MEKIKIVNVTMNFADLSGQTREVLRDINLTVPAGEFLCLLGPSGCGKTTLMNLMAGFIRPVTGRVLIDGEEVRGPDPRHITIFQDYGLFPWRSVLENVTFGLEARGIKGAKARDKAMAYLELVGLADFAGAFPRQLSGGMKQRVSIARALAVEPDVLFMDEPFGALDTFTRFRLQEEILRIWKEKKQTIVFVTHDLDEAVYLADRIAIMAPNPGRIQRLMEIRLPRPCDRTGAGFETYRHEVFREFKLIHEETLDYVI